MHEVKPFDEPRKGFLVILNMFSVNEIHKKKLKNIS